MKRRLSKRNRAKKGRPVTTGKSPMIGIRLPKAEIARLDRWGKAHGHGANRSGAVRALIAQGMRATRSARITSAGMAGRIIDNLADPQMPAEERAARKRRLLKGPKEFRGMR